MNDSARSMMARIAEWRDDLGGITTGGTATTYTVATNRVFTSAGVLDKAIVTIVPHVTSGADPTLSVDGLTARPIRTATGVNVPSGSLVAGTPYALVYVNASTEFILLGFDANPYNIPLGGMIPYIGATSPHTSYALPSGQAISRTTYAALFALVGTTYGAGDGSTTFNLPDLRGRVIAGQDDMGGTSANRLTNQTNGLDGDILGATGGEETHILTQAQLPAVSPTFTGTPAQAVSVVSTVALIPTNAARLANYAGGVATAIDSSTIGTVTSTGTLTATGTISALGSGTPLNIVQPTIILNYILRII